MLTSPYFSHAAAGGAGAPPPADPTADAHTVRKLDVALYDRAVITFPIRNKDTNKMEILKVPVLYDKQTGDPAYIHNTHAFYALCGGPEGNVKVAIRDFLGKHPTLDEVCFYLYYLYLSLITFAYLRLPSLTFAYLRLPSLTFAYLHLPSRICFRRKRS